MLELVISGAQNGVDIAALRAAKDAGIPTSGWMPKGYRTLDGNKPHYADLYNVKEHSAFAYNERTHDNVSWGCATLRIASVFTSPGELCTLHAIHQYKKPYFDIKVLPKNTLTNNKEEVVQWILGNGFKVLNVAGNSEQTRPGIERIAYEYLKDLFSALVLLKDTAKDTTNNGEPNHETK